MSDRLTSLLSIFIPFHRYPLIIAHNCLANIDWSITRKAVVMTGTCVNTKPHELFLERKRCSCDAGSLAEDS